MFFDLTYQLAATASAVVAMDRVGRKRLLLYGAFSVSAGMAVLAISCGPGEESLAGFLVGCSLCLAGYGMLLT